MGAATPGLREYRDFAMGHEGNASRGREIFFSAQTACSKCHTLEGSATNAGPDLSAVGDKFPRRDMIRSVIEPSSEIAIGYGSTIIDTKADETFTGIIKQSTDQYIELRQADAQTIRIPLTDIASQRGSAVSLMPDGLQSAMSMQEFDDLIEFLVNLKQPENALTSNRGMPSNIPQLATAITVKAMLAENLRFPPDHVPKPGDVNNGLVWFGQVPGLSNTFVAGHQTGKIWLLEGAEKLQRKSVFADLEVFHERGPNGLLGMAFHPRFRENRKYFVKHQVFEDGKIATVIDERTASADLKSDSGKPPRKIWKVVSSTQDHSGGCIMFGPDGYLYIGMGDTGPQNDPQGHGQDLKTHLGKILRIDVDHQENDLAYAIPADNPFRNRADARPEIWAYGFREPWRFSFDKTTGDLWAGDVGQDRVEEVSIVRRGENLGWNVYEGFEPFSNQYRKEKASYTPPVFAYRRKFGNSMTGGYVYRADPHSSFYGVYICGDYTSRRIFGIKQQDRMLQMVRQIGTSPQGIASFATDDRGEIYIVGYEGMIYHLDLTGAGFDHQVESSNTPAATRTAGSGG